VNLLHIDSSILGAYSVSRQVSAAIVARLLETTPDATVIYRDLAAQPVAHLSGSTLSGAPGTEVDVAHGNEVLEEFLAAQTVVIGVPMYNFTVPTQFKAWVDRILVAERTFRYTATGPVGLAGGKRVIVGLSRGGIYSPGSPAAIADHQEPYLRAVFGFIGITDVEFVRAEGIAISPEQRQLSLDGALKLAAAIAA
jgi:FMN-dependent NADH-azoreductase